MAGSSNGGGSSVVRRCSSESSAFRVLEPSIAALRPRVVDGVLDVGPELAEDVPGVARRQCRAATHEGMAGVGAAFGIPGVGDEGGSVDAGKAGKRGHLAAAV